LVCDRTGRGRWNLARWTGGKQDMEKGERKTYPVILTVGDRGRARPVLGLNKGFLDLAGAPVFTHVLATLEKSPSVDRIYVVGPKPELEEALTRPGIPFMGAKPVRVLAQWETLYLNIWNAFQAVVEDQEQSSERGSSVDMPVLVVPCDIPLLSPDEVEEFVASCDMERFDYVAGLSSDRTLSRYYPQRHRKGIRLMCFHLREGSFRQNNLHMVKPNRVVNREYIQKIYDHRLQREWGSILRLLWEILRTQEKTWRTVGQYLLLHLAAILHRLPGFPFHRIAAVMVSRRELEETICGLLGTRFTTAETRQGGAALDIDTLEHYGVIRENFEAWRWMQREDSADSQTP
jgi:GTP:adenosylcobinamide-phosphate guanylyltransferase